MRIQVQSLITLIVISSYLLKSAGKIISGLFMSIPILVADGIHGLFDIVEHVFLVIGGYFARKQDREKYPLDRQPLIDLMGLLIYAGLMIFGITIIIRASGLFLQTLIATNWLAFEIPSWVPLADAEIFDFPPKFLLAASIIMLISYVISEIVYRFEYKTAVKHRIREMQADAAELRTDGWLELGSGFGLLGAWGLAVGLAGRIEENHISALILVVNATVLLLLGAYLIYTGWPEFWKNFNNLMNVSLDKDERKRLEKTINKRLPDGCELISPLVCYHRGDQLFVKGHLLIDIKMMRSADLIIRNVETITKAFLSSTELDIHPQYSPYFRLTRQTVKKELDELLASVFRVNIYSPTAESFKLMKHGRLNDAISWLNNNEAKCDSEERLGMLIMAECNFRLYGSFDSRTEDLVEDISSLVNTDISTAYRVLFISWLLIYHSTANILLEGNADKVKKIREALSDMLEAEESISDYIMAEAFFALGFSWERCPDYDLSICRNYYIKAESYYLKSGFRSEIDRLYNTWGHLETLTLSLGDAEMHLGVAKDIREVKEDSLGLSFSYGCLADLHGRLGRFKEGIHYYDRDIDILTSLKMDHIMPSILVKKAELLIRDGLINSQDDLVAAGINICYGAEEKLSNPFFARKGIVKGLLGRVELGESGSNSGGYLKEVSRYLKKAEPSTTYERAFSMRLLGRHAGYSGQYSEAISYLRESGSLFASMSDPIHEVNMSIQALICDIESYKWSLYTEHTQHDNSKKENSLHQLKEYIGAAGGMLIDSLRLLTSFIESLEGAKNKRQEIVTLNKLVWFLEG